VFYQTHKITALLVLLIISFSSSAFAKKAPNFSLKGDKQKVSLAAYKNQVVYVDFWASWCKPCQKSFPFMNTLEKKYGNKGLKIIAINLDSDVSAAKGFLKKNPAKFTVAYDPEGSTAGAYGLKVMPTSYLIDRKGNLINVHKGFKENQKAKLERMITKALASR